MWLRSDILDGFDARSDASQGCFPRSETFTELLNRGCHRSEDAAREERRDLEGRE